MANKLIGRPRRIEDIKKAQKMFKKADMTYREISWAILKREDPKTIYRWLRLDVGETTK